MRTPADRSRPVTNQLFGFSSVVSENGSSDGSPFSSGARVEKVEPRGYEAAVQPEISASQGCYIIMGAADDSYDLDEIVRLSSTSATAAIWSSATETWAEFFPVPCPGIIDTSA